MKRGKRMFIILKSQLVKFHCQNYLFFLGNVMDYVNKGLTTSDIFHLLMNFDKQCNLKRHFEKFSALIFFYNYLDAYQQYITRIRLHTI